MPKPILLEVMKARAGIPTNDLFAMLWGQKIRAGSSSVQTLTGIPPLTFNADGTPLISWSMKGNTQQTGTPTPDAPIMPTFCGVRTGNLFPLDATKLHVGRIENDGTIDYEVGTITVGTNSVTYQANAIWRGFYTDYIQANENEKLTFSPNNSSDIAWSCACYDENDNFLGKATSTSIALIRTFTTLAETKKVRISATSSLTEYTITNPKLNLGSTALPYEPYGWKIPITCAGQTVPVYLGQTQTVRRVKKLVLTGEEGTWQKSSRYQGSFFNQLLDTQSVNVPIWCSHAVYTSQITAETYVYGKCAVDGGQRVKYLNLFIGESSWSVSDFQQYLAAQYSAGTPVTVWYALSTPETAIVNEPLAKIGEYADELHSTYAAVTIPTAKGQNTLTVETDLPPSEMTITFKG